jgi:hypothetical protein
VQDPGDPTDVEETFETMSDPETHAELVSSPGPSGSGASESATRYWVVIHPAGTLHDPTNPELYLSLTLELLGWVLSGRCSGAGGPCESSPPNREGRDCAGPATGAASPRRRPRRSRRS